ncbi:MAG: heparinase, partial [Tabrizicola sp.]|nr:heparinase [Tabrizicola sp.]
MIRANRAREAGEMTRAMTRERFGWFADWRAHLAAGRARPAKGFVSQPEPRSLGTYARGKQIMSGNIHLGGTLIEAPGVCLWDIPAPDPDFSADAQGFAWLEDLAAYDTAEARRQAQAWTAAWISRFGKGRGPGWSPDLTGRRIIRWVHNATFLLAGCSKAETEAFYASLAHQSAFLARRWKAAGPGRPRIEALTGQVYAGLSLVGFQGLIAPSAAALAQACQNEVDDEGGIATRNPQELLEVLTLLNWAASAL